MATVSVWNSQGRAARRQDRFWEAETHDVLVIGLSGFISVNMFTVHFILTGKLRAHTRARSSMVTYNCFMCSLFSKSE